MSLMLHPVVYIDLPIHMYDRFFLRLKGLMFTKKTLKDYGILLQPCHFIHMFFMFQPIDIVFLKKDYSVLSTYELVKPYSLLYEKEAYAVLELPLDTIKEKKIAPGTKIHFNHIKSNALDN